MAEFLGILAVIAVPTAIIYFTVRSSVSDKGTEIFNMARELRELNSNIMTNLTQYEKEYQDNLRVDNVINKVVQEKDFMILDNLLKNNDITVDKYMEIKEFITEDEETNYNQEVQEEIKI